MPKQLEASGGVCDAAKAAVAALFDPRRPYSHYASRPYAHARLCELAGEHLGP